MVEPKEEVSKEVSRAVAARLTNSQLAKARDGLIARGVAPKDLVTISQILRLSVFLAITCCDNPDALASDESLNIISK